MLMLKLVFPLEKVDRETLRDVGALGNQMGCGAGGKVVLSIKHLPRLKISHHSSDPNRDRGLGCQWVMVMPDSGISI